MIKETNRSVKYLQKDQSSECWERSWVLWKARSSGDSLATSFGGRKRFRQNGEARLESSALLQIVLSLVWDEQRIYVPGRKHLMVGSCDPPFWTWRRTLTKDKGKNPSLERRMFKIKFTELKARVSKAAAFSCEQLFTWYFVFSVPAGHIPCGWTFPRQGRMCALISSH